MKLHLKKSATPHRPQSLLTEFPPELLDRIITYFIRDPYTTFDQLKSLRLVCRRFNDVAARRVLSCVRLFGRGDNSASNLCQLRAIVSSDLNDHLYVTNTLVVGSWKWRYGDELFVSFRQMRNSGLWVSGMIWNSTFVPFVYLLVTLFVPHFLPLCLYDSVTRMRTRHRLSRGSVLNMPNVRRIIWTAERGDPNWIASSTVKLFLEFQKLSELVILIDHEGDLSHVSKCFSQLHNLRKLKIDVRGWHDKLYRKRPNPINDLGMIIGANLSLTHLELFQNDGAGGNLTKIFDCIPSNSPLKLEHLSISDSFSDIRAIVPHARSLTSIAFCPNYSQMLPVLHSNCIFPPIIQTAYVEDCMINYLRDNPRIVGLSIHNTYDEGGTIFEIMARHSASLTYFSISAASFVNCLQHVRNELLLMQCTKLEQLIIWYDFYFGTDLDVSRELAMALSIIARLPSSLTLVITNLMAFKAYVKHCSRSQNRLLRDLTGRIVYEEPKLGWSGSGWEG